MVLVNCFTNRQQRTAKITDSFSKYQIIITGLSQGSSLDLFFSTFFINNLSLFIDKSTPLHQ